MVKTGLLLAAALTLAAATAAPAPARPTPAAATSAAVPTRLSSAAAASAPGLSRADREALARMALYAENARFRLYVDERSAEVALLDKERRAVWYSNPPDRDADRLANPMNRSRLSSQLQAVVYTPRDQRLVFDTHTHSVARRTFAVRRLPDGARIEYTMSNEERGEEDVPPAVERGRFEARFLAPMSREEREEFLERYELNAAGTAYLRRAMPQYQVGRFLEILERIGYTAEELERDRQAAREAAWEAAEAAGEEEGVRVPGLRAASSSRRERVSVSVPLEYTLGEDGLVVSIDAGRIAGTPGYPLHSLEVLRYFGAAGPEAAGYILVPDGSGALMYLNNGRQGRPPFRQPVYGDQETEARRESAPPTRQAYFPVFGLKNGDRALFTVIEEGEAVAAINADVSGRLHGYNSVAAEFRLLEKGQVTIGTGDKARSKLIFQKEGYRGPIRIRYAFLYGPQADYPGMARYYGGYLQRRGVLGPPRAPQPRFNLQLIGAIDDRRSLAGISYRAMKALTGYRQAVDIVDRLLERGVADIRLLYSGWLRGGLHHRYAADLRPEPALGGEGEFRSMLEELRRRRVDFRPELSILTAYPPGGGFVPRKHAERYLNQSVARRAAFNLATFQRDPRRPAGYHVSTRLLPGLLERAAGFWQRYGLQGVAFADLGAQVRADYRAGRECHRQEARETIERALCGAAQRLGAVAVRGANLPALRAADLALALPFRSSGFSICDESVPFLQLVLRGRVSFTGEPLNLASDDRDLFLRSLETGAELQFLWTYAPDSELKNTGFDEYYATHYQAWLERAAVLYGEWKQVCSRTGAAQVLRRTQVQPGAIEVELDNGAVLLLNYNRQLVVHRGRVVPGQDYLLLERERGE